VNRDIGTVKSVDNGDAKVNEEIISAFKYGTPSQKMSAISRINKSQKTDANMDILVKHFSKEVDSSVRMEIIKFFAKSKYDNVQDLILIALDDEDEAVLKEVYSLCSIYPDIRFENKLISAVSNQSGLMRDEIINVLGVIKAQSAADYLIEIYDKDSSTGNTKVEILRYFSETGILAGQSIVTNSLSSTTESAYVRYMAAIAIGAYPSASNYELTQKILKEDIPELTARIVYVLPKFSQFGDVKKDIVNSAKSEHESVRLYAIKALKDFRNDADIADMLLYRFINDNSQQISLAILEIHEEDGGSGKMREAIIELAESSLNVKLKERAAQILDKNNISYNKK
jgi:HEAT repeat protein